MKLAPRSRMMSPAKMAESPSAMNDNEDRQTADNQELRKLENNLSELLDMSITGVAAIKGSVV